MQLDIGGVPCTGVMVPYSMWDLPTFGATISYMTSMILFTSALSSTSMAARDYTVLEAICVAIGAKTSWIT